MAKRLHNLEVKQTIDRVLGELEEARREVARLQSQLTDNEGVAASQRANMIRVREGAEEMQQLKDELRMS